MLQNVGHGGCGGVAVGNRVKSDGEHGCTQTGQGVHIFFAGCLKDICQAGSRLTDNLKGGIGATLDGFCHTVLVAVGFVIVVDMVLAANNTAEAAVFLHSTGQPVLPNIGCTLRVVVVVLHGRTVGHEDNVQVTFFGVALLDSMAQLVDCIECIVVVRTGNIFETELSTVRGQFGCGHECAVSQISGAGIDCCLVGCVVPGGIVGGVIFLTVIRRAVAGRVIVAVKAVEISQSNADIQRLVVIAAGLQLCDQVLQRVLENGCAAIFEATATAGCACSLFVVDNAPALHGGRGIHHDDNVNALLQGDAGGGNFDLGDTGGLEVDTGTGLVDLNRALVGVFGVIVDHTGHNIDLNSTQNLALVADFHPVGGVGGVAVEGILPLPGQIRVGQFGLAGAVGIGSNVAGDAGLDRSHSLGGGAALGHVVNGGAFDQGKDGAAGRAALSLFAGKLIKANTFRVIGCVPNSPLTAIIYNTPLVTINIADSVQAIAHMFNFKLNRTSGTVADTLGFLIQVLRTVTLGDQVVRRAVIGITVQNMILIVPGIGSGSIAGNGNGVGSAVAGAVSIQNDGLIIIHDDVLVFFTVFDAVRIQCIGDSSGTAGAFGFADVGPVGFDAGIILDIDLHFDSTQGGTVVQNLHGVGAGVCAVVGVKPLPGHIVIRNGNLTGTCGIGSGVNGDTGLDLSQSIGLAGIHTHKVDAIACSNVVGSSRRNNNLGSTQLILGSLMVVVNANLIVAGYVTIVAFIQSPNQLIICYLGAGNTGTGSTHAFIVVAINAFLDLRQRILTGGAARYFIGQFALNPAVGAIAAGSGFGTGSSNGAVVGKQIDRTDTVGAIPC